MMPTSRRRGRWAAIGLLVVASVAACTGGDDDDAAPGTPAGPCGSLGGLAAVEASDAASGGADDDAGDGEEEAAGDDDGPVRVLLFTRTESFRHDSIGSAVEWFEGLDGDGLEVTATEDTDAFTEDGLAAVDVVAFVNTTGDVLDDDEQEAFREWLEAGGGFVGVHAAADTEHDWEWYGDMVGASFTSHPLLLQDVTVTNEAPDDPTVAHLDATFPYTEEWYSYDRNPRETSDVLLTLDEASATYGHDGTPVTEFTMGDDHPVAWSRQQGDGRVWYTNLGHQAETWDDDAFLAHVRAGIDWAADPARVHRRVITDDLEAPVALDVADSGLVLWAERTGDVEVWDPRSGTIRTAASLPTRVEGEGGLIGLRLAPDAAETGDLYVYWTLPGEGPEATNALQRVTLDVDCRFDPDGGETILEVPNELAGHQGGDIQVMPDGTLLLATGDNTANVEDGYAPIGGTGVPATSDARRTSGNPDDLRGKVLRIEPDGSVPEGNLFPADGSEGRPEVYVTGVRNPYRIGVEPDGRIWWGDIGPDALTPGDRGPQGFDELSSAAAPGDHGWPRCIADRIPYLEHDLGTGETGPPFDCTDTVPAVIAYDYTEMVDPALGVGFRIGDDGEVDPLGRSMMSGPWYAPGDDASAALPFRDRLLLHEFSRNLLLQATVDDGAVTALRRVAPWAGVNTPIDVEVGPDGAVYVLEHGTWNDITSGEPALVRIEGSATGTPVELPDAVRDAVEAEAAGDRSGDQVFAVVCSSCHGVEAKGGIGPDLTDVGDRLDHDEVVTIVRDGRGRMPAWEDELSPAEIEAVAEYVRSLGGS